ncbi:glycerophosphodiester phosphodiesterase, putative [Coccidioides posadasii C735 delta SOWgp]|uniref:Glycerophosphodiester phosphodiesterase GDE1 n=2 Tax=Coccidioides posadasii TaxID=199306 RepID=A0A0J6IIU0_COCPO|nr:glycerophosphodiester phosphodiesterase, putative [Coccidioides posadasii C735 delta SOWgp]EER24982.1 glycerophosphodiester phosphodiesterase, putative [Coccidioides posadasii C735 delta SOWgp]KMM71787.1 glycerophosphodiester phosphodiesterase GDE1 [Coccidioides posadasii RMSCC 3488]|eukprot:XP_003067127.1 glycerophosphodiester phosphodiesterase, putative [Coccidioides posadasii C735 delta SOWgp]
MKFGRNLPRNMVPEWSASYIKYKSLKKLIKSAIQAKKNGEEPDLAGFFYSLDRNLEDVDQFYNKKFADCSRRLKLLEDRFGHSVMPSHRLDAEDLDDLLAALLELRGQLRKLQWYGEVNRRGFIKITKKLDKKLPGAQAQMRYLPTKVDPSPFATNARLTNRMKIVNDWLSVLGDEKSMDDASSTHSSLSLKKVPSRQSLNLPASLLNAVDEALRRDDTHILLELLQTLKIAADDLGDNVYPRVLKSLLQRSIFNRSKACLIALLGKLENLDEEDDINKRNCIHRLVISIGRSQTTADSDTSASTVLNFPVDNSNYITPAAPPSLVPQVPVTKEADQSTILQRDDPSVAFLEYLLDNLQPRHRSALLAKDISGRTPLHYGAQYGFKVVCEVIIEHLQAWDMFDVSEGIDGPNWQDEEGWAPLHLSVVRGHPLTTRALLDAENWRGRSEEKAAIRKHVSKSSAVLALATKANFIDIVQLLVDADVDINYQDDQGETALHVAARFGHEKCAKALLEGTEHQKANTELAENTYSWTPLFIACVDGNIGVVQLLIEAGADLERPDSSGWTAKEHAALRGHISIAKLLAEATSTTECCSESDVSVPTTLSSSPPLQSSLADRKSNTNGNGRPAEAIKTFGHRYLTDESMVLVSLGTMDMRKHIPAVNLDRIPMANAHLTQLDTALSIVVSASGAHGEPEIIDLPIQDNLSTEPIVFHSADATKAKIIFDLVPTYAGSKDRVLGRGVALLSSIKPHVGSKRISLQGDSTVPIIAANTLDVIGSVTFNFLIITPFCHPKMSVTEDQTYWKTMASTMVIGHRGLGKNIAGRKSLQLGENTVQSFIAAANLGASYVEVNIQLTKDHVPVIYHDFLVSETGIDAPVHTLTLEQFLHVSDGRTPRATQNTKSARSANPSLDNLREAPIRQRSMSVGEELGVPNFDERMKHTRDFKKKGFKGNTRGSHIQAPFATLRDLFKELPKSVGFNMEMKYPMLHESEEEEMDTYAVELNSFVDTVLTTVYDLGEGRNMIFSSFNPDICLLLSFKQPSIPVLFLTDSGVGAVGDIRASSLQEAIRFASRWNLLGVVTTAEPLVISPRLVKVVKESGLVCVSYGVANNDPANVKLQVNEGIDAVIVDSVLAIRKGLTEAENQVTSS